MQFKSIQLTFQEYVNKKNSIIILPRGLILFYDDSVC